MLYAIQYSKNVKETNFLFYVNTVKSKCKFAPKGVAAELQSLLV